jgi:hypothetical protein
VKKAFGKEKRNWPINIKGKENWPAGNFNDPSKNW